MRTSNGSGDGTERGEGIREGGDVDVDGDMVVGDMEPETSQQVPPPSGKQKFDQGVLRKDVDAIVNGTRNEYVYSAHIHDSETRSPARDTASTAETFRFVTPAPTAAVEPGGEGEVGEAHAGEVYQVESET